MCHIPSTWLSSLLTPCRRSLVAGAALINLILPCIVCFLFLFPSECLSLHILTDLPGEMNAFFFLAYLLWSHSCHQTLLQSLMAFVELEETSAHHHLPQSIFCLRLPGQRREYRGALVTLATSAGTWGCGWDLVACGWQKGALKPCFLASFLFPHCNCFNKVPTMQSVTRSPPIRSDKGQDLKQSLSHYQTSHLS